MKHLMRIVFACMCYVFAVVSIACICYVLAVVGIACKNATNEPAATDQVWSHVQRHVTCYTNGEIIYEADVFDPIYRGNSVDVYDPALGWRVTVSGDCIIVK